MAAKDTKSLTWKPYKYLFFLSFVEGGAVMAAELVGAKLVAPAYGNSLYVWASVLAITLGGLTTGYYLGGRISEGKDGKNTLHKIVLFSGVFVLLMPYISKLVMAFTVSALSLKVGIVVSTLIFIFPPLACFGMVSPMIIRLISQDVNVVGKAAGTVYTVSTTGGILVTFIYGFYLIPNAGLTMSSIITGVALLAFPAYYYAIGRKRDAVEAAPATE